MRVPTLALLSLVFSALHLSHAQPNLTAGQYAVQFGDHFEFRQFYSAIWPTSGMNVTWNYAKEDGLVWGNKDGLDPTTTPGASLFPTATACLQASFVGEFLRSGTAAEEYMGYYAGPTENGICSDPRTQLVYPFTYGNSFTDSLECYEYGPSPRTRTGSVTVTCTAFGTLILPMGTFTDCLLLHQVWSYEDDYGFADLGYSVGETYSIIHAGVGQPLLSRTTSTYTIGGGSIDNASGLMLDALSTGVVSVPEQVAGLVVYPNPTTNVLNIATELTEQAHAILFAFDGREVLRFRLRSDQQLHTLSMDELPAGAYVLRVEDGLNTRSLRVLKR